jgi:serine/threonine protein kinase
VLEQSEKVFGKYTVKAPKAVDNLEKFLQNPDLSLSDRMNIMHQILNAMHELHVAGFVHGDIKLENFLVFLSIVNGKAVITVKLSDFGKTEPADKISTYKTYRGNPRQMPPEKTLSPKGEVFSTALLMIQSLESGFLSDTRKTLIEPKEKKKIPAGMRRRGLEKFLVDNAKCVQQENATICGKTSVLAGRISSYIAPPSKGTIDAETEIHKYIDALRSNMIASGTPEKTATALCALLKKMTLSDPEQRPSMEQAHDEEAKIMKQAAILQSP